MPFFLGQKRREQFGFGVHLQEKCSSSITAFALRVKAQGFSPANLTL